MGIGGRLIGLSGDWRALLFGAGGGGGGGLIFGGKGRDDSFFGGRNGDGMAGDEMRSCWLYLSIYLSIFLAGYVH